MINEESVLKLLEEYSCLMMSLPNNLLHKAIKIHYEELLKVYASNKIFYKTVFRNHRFLLANLIVSTYYTSSPPLLTDVRKDFSKLKLLSENTISAFIAFFRVTKRIEVRSYNGDNRKVIFSISEKLISETLGLINTMTHPVDFLFKGKALDKTIPKDYFLRFFLNNYQPVMKYNLFLFSMIPNINSFIFKDAGHMIMMTIYHNIERTDGRLKVSISIAKIASICGVSRSHVTRIVLDSVSLGFLIFNNGQVFVNEEFLHFVQSYMSYYFSMVCLGLDITPKNI